MTKQKYTLTYKSALQKALRDAVRYQPQTATEGSAWLSRVVKVVLAPFAARTGLKESIARYSHNAVEQQRANLRARPERPTQTPVKNTRRPDISGRQLDKLLLDGRDVR